MSYHHGVLWIKGADGNTHELINHARTASYLSNPALAVDGIDICSILDFGGCAAYPYSPPCDDTPVTSYASFNGSASTYLSVPDAAGFTGSELDIRFAIGDIPVFGTADDIAAPVIAHYTSTTGWYVGIRHIPGDPGGSVRLMAFVHLSGTDTGMAASVTVEDGFLLGRVTYVDASDDLFVYTKSSDPAGAAAAMASNSGWTQVGTTTIGAGSVTNSTNALTIGNTITAGLTPLNAVVYGAQLSVTVNAAPVFTFDSTDIPTDPAAASFTAGSGQTVTAVRGAGPSSLVFVADTSSDGWEPVLFSTPEADQAPWYNPNYPESADALGFFIEEWTGLDSTFVRRGSQPRGNPGGGSQLGKIGASGRVMKLNVLCFARNEAGMEYLYRWLESTLMSVCSSCTTDTVVIRRTCPDVHTESLWDGVVEMREVGLIEGLTWESDPTSRGQCLLRRVSFSLMAGDPCMYVSLVEEVGESVAVLIADLPTGSTLDRSPCRPSCFEYPPVHVTSIDVNSLGAAAPQIEISSPQDDGTVATHVIAYYDPLGQGASDFCGQEILGEIWLRPLPASTTFLWDVLGRKLLYRNASTGDWVDGRRWLQANTPGISRFFAMPCGTIHIAYALGTLCLEETEQGYVDQNSEGGFYFPAFDVTTGERLSCP